MFLTKPLACGTLIAFESCSRLLDFIIYIKTAQEVSTTPSEKALK